MYFNNNTILLKIILFLFNYRNRLVEDHPFYYNIVLHQKITNNIMIFFIYIY